MRLLDRWRWSEADSGWVQGSLQPVCERAKGRYVLILYRVWLVTIFNLSSSQSGGAKYTVVRGTDENIHGKKVTTLSMKSIFTYKMDCLRLMNVSNYSSHLLSGCHYLVLSWCRGPVELLQWRRAWQSSLQPMVKTSSLRTPTMWLKAWQTILRLMECEGRSNRILTQTGEQVYHHLS